MLYSSSMGNLYSLNMYYMNRVMGYTPLLDILVDRVENQCVPYSHDYLNQHRKVFNAT